MNKSYVAITIVAIVACIAIIIHCLWNCANHTKEMFNSQNDAFITFVIPTIGRDSVDTALQSLINLNNPNWKAVVVYDGVPDKNPHISDARIKVIRSNKIGNAGSVRNIGIKECSTEWIAFLDDDDAIAPSYIDDLKETIVRHPDMDVLIFRYYDNNNHYNPSNITPPRETGNTIKLYKVGISFCAKKHVFDTVQFTSEYAEDFTFLDTALKKNHKIVLSKYISYIIRPPSLTFLSDDLWRTIRNIEVPESVITSTSK